eukprot:scaffold877_cov57-Attheya_sp.AAC.13
MSGHGNRNRRPKTSAVSNTVFVRFTPASTLVTHVELESCFSNIGPVKKCSVIHKRKNEASTLKRPLGYGFVKYLHNEDAKEAASKLHGTELKVPDGPTIRLFVELASASSPSADPRDDGEPADSRTTEATTEEKEESRVTKKETLNEDEELVQKRKRTARIIVRNLSFYATEFAIRKVMEEKFGKVLELHLPLVPGGSNKDSKKPQHRGFCFVTFETAVAAQKAVSMGQLPIKNRTVAMDYSMHKQAHQRMLQDKKDQSETKEIEENSDDDDEEEDKNENGDEKSVSDASGSGSDNSIDDEEASDSDASESDDDNSEDGSDDSENEETEKEITKKVAPENDEAVSAHQTLFIRNLPFDATRHDLFMLLKPYGRIEGIFIVTDKQTGMNKGTAFCKFQSAEHAQKALEAAESGKDGFVAQKDAFADGGGLMLNGRRLLVDLAVDKQTASTLKVERDETGKPLESKRTGKDRRYLYLKQEGRVHSTEDSHGKKSSHGPWEELPQTDQQKRERAFSEKATKLRSPLFFINPFRLSIRNLAKHVSEVELKQLIVQGIQRGLEHKLVTRDDVILNWRAEGTMGTRELLGKIRETEEECGNKDLVPPFDGSHVKKFIPSVYIDRDTDLLAKRGGGKKELAPSRGFGFCEFTHHVHALACLREINNNPAYSAEFVGGGKRAMEAKKQRIKKTKGDANNEYVGEDGKVRVPRLVVEFTVENKAKAKEQAERRSTQLANVEQQKQASFDAKKVLRKEKSKKMKGRGALQREKKRKQRENEQEPSGLEKTQAKKTQESAVDKPVTKPPKLMKPPKKQKVDKEEVAFESMVKTYKNAFAGDLTGMKDASTKQVASTTKTKKVKKRWFE